MTNDTRQSVQALLAKLRVADECAVAVRGHLHMLRTGTGPGRWLSIGHACHSLAGLFRAVKEARNLGRIIATDLRVMDAAESGASIAGGDAPTAGLFACAPAVASQPSLTPVTATCAVAGRGGDVGGQSIAYFEESNA